MNTEQELRCCPFCGTSNKLKVTPYRADDDGGEPFDWGFTVICSALGFSHAPNRGCGASGAWGETEAKAIAAWNRRAPAVAAGGVTEERVRVAADTLQVALNRQGWITSGGLAERTARAILAAALAVGDEGIREGKPKRCHKCHAPRTGEVCHKCGGPLEEVAEGWTEPRLPPIDKIRRLAESVGYALGVHGSLERDLDLIAAPWIDDAVSAEELAQHIARSYGLGPRH